jgi:putative PEP-CTERM system histidine kinase
MPATVILLWVSAACAAALSIGVAATARRSLSRWAFSAGMLALAVESLFAGLGAHAADPDAARTWQQRRLLIESVAPALWLLFSLTYARGDSRQSLAGSRLALACATVAPILAAVFYERLLLPLEAGLLPAPALHAFRLPWSGLLLHALFLLGWVGVVMNLERTFRASVGTIRWRIKFMLLGVGVIFVARIYTGSQALVFRGLDVTHDSIDAAALLVALPLILRAFLRTGRADFHVYPSRAVLHGSVTLVLAGAYLLIVGALAKVVTYFGGESAFAIKALLVLLALVALALLLQSDRVNQRLRVFVSRHFERPAYDYRTVWSKFTSATAACVDQVALTRAIAGLHADIFHALSVSVWVVADKDGELTLAASTVRRETDATDHRFSAPAAEIIAHFRTHPEPVDLESSPAPWAYALRELHPTQFPNGGRRCCAPLVIRGEVLGVITLGDRVSGTPMSPQDFEMLKCVADHAAASLMNVLLSQRLMQAKELEAFQTMAAFFVHDLKNSASTLNLMLQNLPVHFDSPEFRADALRGIAKTVGHINQLIRRLGQLRHELTIELTEGDFNDVVTQALATLEPVAEKKFVRDIRPLPATRFDREQLNKVVTNLILNATEAVPSDGGRVCVSTSTQDDWVVLTVDDNGCGMSRDFLTRSLFRPFQTTKTSGLGIGMFQSKMIVEAHGGRIAVRSEPGKGTTFQVFLRTAAAT